MAMFLFILLIMAACLYFQDLLNTEVSKLKYELNNFVGSLTSNIRDNIKNIVDGNLESNIYSKLNKA